MAIITVTTTAIFFIFFLLLSTANIPVPLSQLCLFVSLYELAYGIIRSSTRL